MAKLKCGHCQERRPKEEMDVVGLQAFCRDKGCKVKAALSALDGLREKRKRKLATAIKKEDKKRSKAARDLKANNYSHQHTLTKREIQKWVNHVRDAGLPCICCGALTNAQYCGGHYRTAGGYRELALDARNIHRQRNRLCNCGKSGNIGGDHESHGFKEGIRLRYGQALLDWLDGPHKLPGYTCDQLREIRAYYAKLTRDNNPDDSSCPHRPDPHIVIISQRSNFF